MAHTDRIMQAARTHLPGAVDAAIELELYNAVDEMCREGRLWRETVSIPFVEDQDTYGVAPDDGAEAIEVYSVSHDGYDLSGALYERGAITLPFLPSASHVADNPFFVVAAFAPSYDATNTEGLIPVDMWTRYRDIIVAGLVSRMMFQPGKPYSNPQLAMLHRRDFTSKLAVARHQMRTNEVPGQQLWQFPRHTR
jgi:hypothetical protein